MQIKYGAIDIEMIKPSSLGGRTRDLAALQRETKWKLKEINELVQLEGPGMALALFLSFRAVGRLITYARAEELLDEVEFIATDAEIAEAQARAAGVDPEQEPDPTSAPTGSVRGGDVEHAEVSPL